MGFDLKFFNIICMNSVCKIMQHILVFIVNLDFDKDNHWGGGGGLSFGGTFLKRKLTLFFF